ncbi:hypothetical protein ACFPL7_15945 [Dongia soli]|uniref:Uncharacterized protein n=1 Tax=Dongia soli TaxID=600628 RepID=A0ABU5ECK8_9PROT|nr:hypothetical protein [Dongia soli]MDY0883611.1 hypothetical protein [Dongia soli]
MATQNKEAEGTDYIAIVFEGAPNHEGARFVQVENSQGESIRLGEWIKAADAVNDRWELRLFVTRENGKMILNPPSGDWISEEELRSIGAIPTDETA